MPSISTLKIQQANNTNLKLHPSQIKWDTTLDNLNRTVNHFYYNQTHSLSISYIAILLGFALLILILYKHCKPTQPPNQETSPSHSSSSTINYTIIQKTPAPGPKNIPSLHPLQELQALKEPIYENPQKAITNPKH